MAAKRVNAICVWNDGSGTAHVGEPLRGACEEHFQATHTTAQEVEQVLRKHGSQTPLVIAAGGDGTINTVINALSNTKSTAAMGVLPLGTGNDFCRSLGVPLDPYEALRVIVEGHRRRIDLGVIDYGNGQQRFGNVAAGGNADQMKQQITSEMKSQWGPLCYVRGAVAAMANLQGYETRLRIEGYGEEVLSLWNVVVANGQFSGGGMEVAPGSLMDDGWLDVVAILDGTPIDLATMAAGFVLGNFLDHERVRHWRVKQVTITSTPPMTFSLDGEDLHSDHYDFSVQPKAIEVIVPSAEFVPK
jgi:diacylglycerol kinase (ATP)